MRTTRFSGHHYMQHWGEYTWYPHPIPSCIPAPWYTHPHLSGIPTQYSLVYPPSPKGPGPRDTPTRKGPRTSHTLPPVDRHAPVRHYLPATLLGDGKNIQYFEKIWKKTCILCCRYPAGGRRLPTPGKSWGISWWWVGHRMHGHNRGFYFEPRTSNLYTTRIWYLWCEVMMYSLSYGIKQRNSNGTENCLSIFTWMYLNIWEKRYHNVDLISCNSILTSN